MKSLGLFTACLFLTHATVSAQPCGQAWIRGEENAFAGVGGQVLDALWWDPDGEGPEPEWLFLAGYFIGGGSQDRTGTTAWDGANWRQMTNYLTPWSMRRLTLVDNAIYASTGTSASFLFRWTLSTGWTLIRGGQGDPPSALAAHEGRLVIGSAATTFSQNVDATFTSVIASWDGVKWRPFPPLPIPVERITALQSFQGALYAGYTAPPSGVNFEHGLLKLENDVWTVVPNIRGSIEDFCISNGRMYAAGLVSSSADLYFSSIGAFDGQSWDNLDGGLGQRVTAIAPYRDGVIAVGEFTETSEGVPADRIAAWYDGAWHGFPGGPRKPNNLHHLSAVAVSGERIAAGGDFTTIDGVGCLGIALRENDAWRPLNSGLTDEVYAITRHRGRAYLGGRFRYSTTGTGSSVVAWNGRSLEPVAQPLNGDTRAITAYNGDLVVGGSFIRAGTQTVNRIATLQSGAWRPLGVGVVGTCRALAEANGLLYAGGELTRAGGLTVRNIAQWDGSNWSPVGSGINGRVNCIVPYGQGIIVGGQFTEAGGVPANSVAYWDGTAWHPVGAGFDGAVYSMIEFNGSLYAGGALCRSGTASLPVVARWTGTAWVSAGSNLPNGCPTSPYASTAYDLVIHESVLYVACGSLSAAGYPDYSASVLRLSGTSWINHTLPLSTYYMFANQSAFFTIESYESELLVGGQFLFRPDFFAPDAHAFWARWSPDRTPWIAQQTIVGTDGIDATISCSPASGYDTTVTPLTIQWRRNGVPVLDGPSGASPTGGDVEGATTTAMTIRGLRPSDAGDYTADFSNGCAIVTSLPGTLDFVDPLCPADINASGTVDVSDFVVFATHYGTQAGARRIDGDCNADGRIDAADLVVLASQFGLVCQEIR